MFSFSSDYVRCSMAEVTRVWAIAMGGDSQLSIISIRTSLTVSCLTSQTVKNHDFGLFVLVDGDVFECIEVMCF